MKIPDLLAMYSLGYKSVCVEAEKVRRENTLENNKNYKVSLDHFLGIHKAITKELESEIQVHIVRTCKAINLFPDSRA